MKEWLKLVLNYRSYPKNKTGYPFFLDHRVYVLFRQINPPLQSLTFLVDDRKRQRFPRLRAVGAALLKDRLSVRLEGGAEIDGREIDGPSVQA